MSLAFQCDSCGATIPADDVRTGKALVVKGRHYCPSCKGPIVAFLKQKRAQGGGAAPAPTASKAQPAPRPGPPGQAPSKAPAKRPAPAKTGPRPTAPRPASPEDSTARAREKLLLRRAGSREGAKRPAAPARPAPKAPGARRPVGGAARGAPGARTARSGRIAPRHGHTSPRGARLERRRGRAARSGELPDEPPSRTGLIIGVSLGATAVAIGAVVFVFVFGDGAPPETPSDPQPTVASSVETQPADATAGAQPAQPSDGDGGAAASQTEEQALEERQRKLVGDLRDRFAALRDDPDALIDFQTELYLVQRGRGLLPTVLSQLSELASEVESRKNELARKVFEETLTQSAKLQDEKSYGQAHELWRVPPRVIEQSGFLTRWHEEERRAESYAEKARLWDKLVAKANKYLAQGDRDIAIAILEENVPESFEAEYERIWNEREEFVREIRLKEAERIRLESEIQRKAREARIAAIRAERNKERQEKWENLLDLYPWVPLLSEGGDLENWFMTVDSIIEQGVDPFPWKNTRVGDEQVLSADARDREGEGEVYIGINGNRWLDWALEFEVQVLEGRLLLEPRNTVQAFFGAMRVQLSAEEPLVFEAADHSNWTQVRLEVRGNLVRLIENGEIKKEHYTDHDRGGFRFVLPHGGVCQIKGIRIKWVSTLDPGEEGTSEFTDEDLDDW